ncbi:MAG: N-acetylmuramoyl-L-alanine amidase [Oscillospiraceae bacterium]|nr:N-acetylmuramoyl-L-alanine amidase [Oscillospiraceae bacterium]
MPIIYLSPSTQENNYYVTGGTEEYHMNQLADTMIPYLISSAIQYKRNTPEMNAGSSIRQANEGYYDIHLALHSNASGEGKYGTTRGIIVFYYPGSAEGKRAAEIFAKNLRTIYPQPDLVRTEATTTLGEVAKSKFPAVLIEMGYHDNTADAKWITGHTEQIAQNLVLSLTELFKVPFIYPIDPWDAKVRTNGGTLKLRSRPTKTGTVLVSMPNGSAVRVYGYWQGWYVVHYKNYVGYASADYIS